MGSAHDAEDVVQESFVRAWRALPRFAGERRFYPWLTVIAANLCVDTLRRRSRLTPVEESRITASDTGTYEIEDAVLHEVDAKMVATAFGQLSTRHQRVLKMREGSEWSYRKIAEHEGVGVTAVETLLWRARQALKREFLILDEQKGKVGALIGFLVVFPARAVARLPKALKHGVSHAVEGTKNAAASLGSGAFGDFGSGALGVFGPSVAAATGAVAITVGTVLMLPASGPVTGAGSSNPAPITTVLPALASPIASASTSSHTPSTSTTGSAATGTASTKTVSGLAGSVGGTGSSIGSVGSPGPFGLGEFGIGTILQGVAAAGQGPGAISNLGSAIGGPVGGAINGAGSAAKGLAGTISPAVGAVVGGAENTVNGVVPGPGAATPSPGAGTGATGSGTKPSPGASSSGPFSSTNSTVNALTKALGIPLNLGS